MKKYSIKATVYDKRGKVLSIGYNSYVKTHPMMYEYGKKLKMPYKIFLHAEIAALIKIKDKTTPHKIFIERYGKDGKPRLAAPCPICLEAIRQAGIEKVEFTVG